MEISTWVKLLADSGMTLVFGGAVLWLAWYRETKTIPAMTKAFSDSTTKILSTFTGSMKELEDGFSQRQKEVMQTFRETTAEERKLCIQWHQEHMGRLDQQGKCLERLTDETRENRHYMRDVVHILGLKAKVEEERAKRHPPPGESST